MRKKSVGTVHEGYGVTEVSISMASRCAGHGLRDFGADVVKVEASEEEWQRFATAHGVMGIEMKVSVATLTRNRRLLAVCQQSDGGHEIVCELRAAEGAIGAAGVWVRQ